MTRARLYTAIVALLSGIAYAAWHLLIERDPVSALSGLAVGLAVGEAMRPDIAALNAVAEREGIKGPPDER